MSVRELARQIGISDSHLSRILRRADDKRPSPELTARVAAALGLAEDYFPEFREGFVVDRVRSNAKLRDELYSRLRPWRRGSDGTA